jgi:ABC-type multidrug transport system ATPase subunit
MMVRLGFAVAAHLDPEILVVDEVLAVGDAEFQKKAIGKMQDVSSGEGRTVLFVSHNMASVKALCKNGILLENGMLKYMGGIKETVDYYIGEGGSSENQYFDDLMCSDGRNNISGGIKKLWKVNNYVKFYKHLSKELPAIQEMEWQGRVKFLIKYPTLSIMALSIIGPILKIFNYARCKCFR